LDSALVGAGGAERARLRGLSAIGRDVSGAIPDTDPLRAPIAQRLALRWLQSVTPRAFELELAGRSDHDRLFIGVMPAGEPHSRRGGRRRRRPDSVRDLDPLDTVTVDDRRVATATAASEPPHDDQKKSETTKPTIPTTSRIAPTGSSPGHLTLRQPDRPG
jgi:hypothetical protein